MSPVTFVVIISAGLAVVLTWLFRKLFRSTEGPAFSAEWWENFSAERYIPIANLLSEEDFTYMRHLPGYEAGAERAFRDRRVKICRAYLTDMREDFGRLQALGQALIVAGKADASFQDKLFEQKVRFTRAWWMVRIELEAYRFGVGQVHAGRLVELLDGTVAQIQPVMQPA